MIRPILQYPAEELQQESIPVENFDEELAELCNDMLETMYAAPGIGLAAPQLGINRRLAVVDVTSGQERGHQHILVNPKIIDQKGSQKEEEGCLSIPGFTASVKRPVWIQVKAQGLDGQYFEFEARELLARAICHEVDHLDGILYIDRISPLKRDLIKRKIRRLIRAGEW